MKVTFVTGATGFLGKHLVRQLLASEEAASVAGPGEGPWLRVLCRGASPWDQDPRVEVHSGDVTSIADVMRAARGAAEIYHLAGIVARDPRQAELLYHTHIEGTRNVCEAALEHGARKVIHVSSSGTVAVSREPLVHDERSGSKVDLVGEWPYYLSKIFAEKLAQDYFRRHEAPVVVASPSLLLGPGDDRRSSTGDLALLLRGGIKALPLGGLNFVDARDAAAGLIGAMRAGQPGERYLLGGTNWTFKALIEHAARLAGMRAPRMQPSLGLSLASARLLRLLLPLLGKNFELDDASIKMSALFWYCDSSKARRDLGFVTRDPLETLKDTIDDIRRRRPRADGTYSESAHSSGSSR